MSITFLYASGFNAFGQLSPDSTQDITQPEVLVVSQDSDIKDTKVLFSGWSETAFYQHGRGKANGCIKRHGSTKIVQEAPLFDLTSGFGDHNGLLGVLSRKGGVAFTEDNQIEAHTATADALSDEETPGIAYLAVAGNGHVAVVLAAASSPRNSILEFTSFAKFREWFDDEVNDLHGPSASHTVPGRVAQLVANVTGFVCLTQDGNVYSWGDARHSSLGRSVAETEARYPGLVGSLGGVHIKKIASDGWMTAALSEDGAVYLFGTGTPGTEHSISCLRELESTQAALVEIEGTGESLDFLDVAVGDGHVLLLVQDGRVFAAGDNRNGQLGVRDRVFNGRKQTGKLHIAQANPNTTTPAVPRPAVKTCAVCYKDQPPNVFPDINHSGQHNHEPNTCRKCFNRYIVGQIGSGQDRIKCAECQEHLSYEIVRQIVSKTSLGMYDKVLLKRCVEEDDDFHYCMSAKCKSGQIHIGGLDSPLFNCKVCKRKHCVDCKVPLHEGESCDDYQARHDEETLQSEAAVFAMSRACPGGCGARIERDGGCPHMLCTKCGHEFCFLCLGDYNHAATEGMCPSQTMAQPEPYNPSAAAIKARRAERQARKHAHSEEDESSVVLLGTITKPCPKCKVPIEKNGGCDHMTCASCHYQFCWLCSTDYALILRSDNRAHAVDCVYHPAHSRSRVEPSKSGPEGNKESVERSRESNAFPRTVNKDTDEDEVTLEKRNAAQAELSDDEHEEGGSKKKQKVKLTGTKKKAHNAKKAAVLRSVPKARGSATKMAAGTAARRGTRTGLRSSTATASSRPVTRAQSRALEAQQAGGAR
ncbi:RCC1/BLIP-II protein [Aureobasidium subglaciale]|nr:RCC1/BLIP-II protein [Aureobasidium subglaciale]KAI5225717.1 RCC1/BLIP-II protein [Aureobasidium subglaciale]KAI5229175.1 RCC1/BLIP-II protein [Aureobasidium subglaciale]KAI5263977.1 RCC1/BLIP-II protein [Aureobasidium subglaciale]